MSVLVVRGRRCRSDWIGVYLAPGVHFCDSCEALFAEHAVRRPFVQRGVEVCTGDDALVPCEDISILGLCGQRGRGIERGTPAAAVSGLSCSCIISLRNSLQLSASTNGAANSAAVSLGCAQSSRQSRASQDAHRGMHGGVRVYTVCTL